MVNLRRTVDEEGFTSVRRRRSRSVTRVCEDRRGYEVGMGRKTDLKSRKGESVKIERKVIGGSMGKKGTGDVLHLAVWSGIKRSFCWLSYKAGLWFSRLLKREANGCNGKLSQWNFRDNEDWIYAAREENKMGQYIRILVSHNKEYPTSLFFPVGDNGVSWWETGMMLESLLFGVSKSKGCKKMEAKPAVNVDNAWLDGNIKHKSQFDGGSSPVKSKPEQVANSSWHFNWKEVGRWIMDRLGWSLSFELQPIDDLKAVFTIKTTKEFNRIRDTGSWKVNDVEIRIYPWYASINAIPKSNPWSLKKKWIGVKGVPFNLYPESSMATDLSEIKICVNGPVSNGVWCEEVIIGSIGFWVEIRLIGEEIEPSRFDMKPISIFKDRMKPSAGTQWRRKPTPITVEEEDGGRGSLGNGKNHGCTKNIAVLADGTTEGLSSKAVSRDDENLNSENSSTKASTSSVSLNSSLRSLKKQLKCKMSNGVSSSSISSGSVNEGAYIGAKDNPQAHIGCSTNDLVVDDSDDDVSCTSGSSNVKDDEPNDAVKMAKGIAAKFKAVHGKLKDT
ncbi:hypothetical protein MKW98_008274, partial [Papaver atlanticum]